MLRGLRVLACAVICVAAIALTRDTRYQGQDFEVVWRAGRALLGGNDPYAISIAPGMVFKYPPWILPLILPLAVPPVEVAKWIWGGIQVLSLLSVCVWLRREARCRIWLIGAVGAAFWGIWVVHALDGQIVIPVLAVSVWGWTLSRRGRFLAGVAVILALSTKIFWLLALVGLKKRTGWTVQGALAAGTASVVAILLWVGVATATGRSIGETFSAWVDQAASGGAQLDPGKIRGVGNQGLPAAAIRAFGAPAGSVTTDIAATSMIALFLLAWGLYTAQRTDDAGAWSIGLALAAAAHPLAWVHTYALAFPACALALERAIKERGSGVWTWVRPALAGLSVGIVAFSTQKLFGSAGEALELGSARAWGCIVATGVIAGIGKGSWGAARKDVAPFRTLR